MSDQRMDEHPLLAISDLTICFETNSATIQPVDHLSLNIPRNRTVALVGESGCGKSVTALSILRLLPEPPTTKISGRIDFIRTVPMHIGIRKRPPSDGRKIELTATNAHNTIPLAPSTPIDLLTLPLRDMESIRGSHIAMIFQDPLTSLNPVFTVGQQIIETLTLHQGLKGKQARARAIDLLDKVGLKNPEKRVDAYPHELSGGMRQRAMIAMALSCNPSLLIADEPTTALDVTVQRQILDLLQQLQQETGMSLLIITHDLGVVSEIADEVYVMYAGHIVEHAPTSQLFQKPLHPYTQGLLSSTLLSGETQSQPRPRSRLRTIPGQVPDPSAFPSGCRFHPRCQRAFDGAKETNRESIEINTELGDRVLRRCVEPCDGEASGVPRLVEVSPHHHVACWEAQSEVGK